jgi:hypothetical protein
MIVNFGKNIKIKHHILFLDGVSKGNMGVVGEGGIILDLKGKKE